jgi:hypothetical protein
MQPVRTSAATEVLAGLVERVTFHNAENGAALKNDADPHPRHAGTVPRATVRAVIFPGGVEPHRPCL